MAIGPTIRKMVGPRMERVLSTLYRRVFVDLDAVARALSPHLPQGARILDIGGGDGELINKLFAARPDLTVDLVDIAPIVGRFVEPSISDRVRLFPNTPVESLPMSAPRYDAALVSDVMHHLPAGYRRDFLAAVHAQLAPTAVMFIKDIEPGHPIAWLSLFCDKHVSGDKGVSLVALDELEALASHLPARSRGEIGLIGVDPPNYLYKLAFEG